MCGICGKLNFNLAEPVSAALVKSMADTIAHRGPDDEGYYCSGPIGLGFRRLSIIDLATGHQPIGNEDSTVWIVFNGEIYNYRELRQWLLSRGHVFTTQTDTEVIVHLYEEIGPRCVEKLRGMFAFGIWDERKRSLFLARDRVGIKPLYYRLTGESLVFGSEIKALLVDRTDEPQVLPQMIDRFLTFQYLPGEETLFENVYKVPPGSYLVAQGGKVTVTQYWDLAFTQSGLSLKDASDQLTGLLEESVRLHMISDVPVGFLLSGGVDSTAVLGIAASQTDRPLSSFTLGFETPGITDERPYARLAASTYGSDHHELTISSQQFQEFLPKYIWHMEEPVCEPPAIALYYVSKLAKDYVKVLLSGEGGDEAFGGYQNYRSILWLERLKSALAPFNRAVGASLQSVNRTMRSGRISKYAPLLDVPFESYYFSRTSSPMSFFNSNTKSFYTSDFADSVRKEESLAWVKQCIDNSAGADIVNRMLYVDTKTWLTDDLLLKADKMTMANSVELRVPLLDHKLLEFAASLPGNYKVRRFTTKYIAKSVLEKRVPRPILKRRKIGFPVPYGAWLQTEMKDWVNDLLTERETIERGYFRKEAIKTMLASNNRSGGHSREVFSLAVLELWHRAFLNPQAVAHAGEGSPALVGRN